MAGNQQIVTADRQSPALQARSDVSGVISGWIEALSMMPVGSKWRLTIPHHLAYGERGAGQFIGPNEALQFNVKVIDVLPGDSTKVKK